MREDTRSDFNRQLLKKVSAYGFKQRRVGDCCVGLGELSIE
ncbi:hypothetical protein QUA08_26030 [Microcoleus sp. T3B2]